MVAGIAGSPHMISATIISVSRVVYEFRSEYSTRINNSFCKLFGLKWLGVILVYDYNNLIHLEFLLSFRRDSQCNSGAAYSGHSCLPAIRCQGGYQVMSWFL